MNERDLLRAYPAYAPYRDALREIFENPPDAFAERFPHLAKAWEPYLRSLFDWQFDIDSIRKAASDNRDFQQWLLDKNRAIFDVSSYMIDEFIGDLGARFLKRNHHPMDSGAVHDVRGAIESFLAFASHQRNRRHRKTRGGQAHP